MIDDHPLHFNDYSFHNQHIHIIFQNPSTSLNPHQHISQILNFPLHLNTDLKPKQHRKQIIETIHIIKLLPNHINYYPHILTPKQKQHLNLTHTLILHPKIIITDKTLTSLNISIHSQLINLILKLQKKQNISYIYITQHIEIIKHINDQILIIHQNEIIERNNTTNILTSPLHKLTKQLITDHFNETLTTNT